MKIDFRTPNYFVRKIIKAVQIICGNFMPRRIMTGAFEGLEISKNSFGSGYTPKILGTYEEEISTIVKNRLLDKCFSIFVDVGCAGGYYCEIARQLREDIQIVGYDLDSDAIEYCKKTLAYGRFKNDEFNYNAYRDIDKPILFLFDIEGGEFSLFNELTYLNPQHEFIIEVHCFGLNSDKSITMLNAQEFYIREIPYVTMKNSLSSRRSAAQLEFFLRHELRESRTKYVHIRPKLLP